MLMIQTSKININYTGNVNPCQKQKNNHLWSCKGHPSIIKQCKF